MAAEKHYDLTRLDDFIAAMRRERVSPLGAADPGVHGIHCPKCGAQRRVDIQTHHLSGRLTSSATLASGGLVGGPADGPRPVSAFELSCVQCRTTATALVYEGPNGPDLVILWSHLGGLRTPHTPDGVAYYLDQAARSESVAARSAAVTMYRAACEQILLEQGFKKRMLGPKLGELEGLMTAGTAPKWASELHAEYLAVLKDLGNAATHAGDGDVSKQDELDTALLADVRIVVERLLESIYEQPLKDAGLLSRLRSKADKVK
jgi:Domain of unknown function (DUF4145)